MSKTVTITRPEAHALLQLFGNLRNAVIDRLAESVAFRILVGPGITRAMAALDAVLLPLEASE